MDEKNVEMTISDKLNDFFSRHRKSVIIVSISVLVVVAAVIAAVVIVDNTKKNEIATIETVILDFEKFKVDKLKNSLDSLTEEEKTMFEAEKTKVIEKLSAYRHKKNYAGFMANQEIADIYFADGNFEKALAAYECITLGKDNYTSGVLFFNAACCADELGQSEKAADLYAKAGQCENFPFRERALFNAARVQENIDKAKAMEAYKQLVADYPNTEWASLSKTRLIELGL